MKKNVNVANAMMKTGGKYTFQKDYVLRQSPG